MPAMLRLRRLGYRLAARLLALRWAIFAVRPDGVKCVIVDGDRLLLVRHTYGIRAWDLPGGAAHRAEAPAVTADREMTEELGLSALAWRDLGELSAANGAHRVRVVGATVTEPTLRIDPVELAVAEWFSRDRLPPSTAPLCAAVLRAGPVAAFVAGDAGDLVAGDAVAG